MSVYGRYGMIGGFVFDNVFSTIAEMNAAKDQILCGRQVFCQADSSVYQRVVDGNGDPGTSAYKLIIDNLEMPSLGSVTIETPTPPSTATEDQNTGRFEGGNLILSLETLGRFADYHNIEITNSPGIEFQHTASIQNQPEKNILYNQDGSERGLTITPQGAINLQNPEDQSTKELIISTTWGSF